MENQKNVDEGWKDSVVKEKQEETSAPSDVPKEQSIPEVDQSQTTQEMPEVNFIGYITSLAYQTMIFLGEVPNPMDNTTEANLLQAKFIIDTLCLLRDKTTGNLSQQEADTLNAFLYELQMKYVEKTKKTEIT